MAKKKAKKSAKKAVKKAAKKTVKKASKKVAKKKATPKKAAAKKPAPVAEKKTTTINPYLTFNGNCEEAFDLYHSVFGGKYDRKVRFKDMPMEGQPPMPEEMGNRIMHVSLPIAKNVFLMGSDANPMMGEVTFGQHLSLSVTAESNAKADKVFHGLAQGGKITMPLAMQFWGSYFGMLEDKFGIIWLVSCEPEKK